MVLDNLTIGRLLAGGLLLATLVAPNQSAEAAAAEDVLEILENVTDNSAQPSTRILDDVSDVPTHGASELAVASVDNGAEVIVPTRSADPIEIAVPNSEAGMTIQLPFADEASPALPVRPGVVAFDNENDTSTATVIKTDGTLVIATIIENSNAPHEFSYTVEGAPGSFLELQANGSVLLFDSRREIVLGGFLPPWARDADGHDVPTHYKVSGSKIIQTVDLTSPEIVYPVVADPQAGYTILEGVWKNRPGGYSYKGGAQWSTRLSAWGGFLWTQGVVGHQTVKTQGWVEWKNGVAPETTSIHQQFDCHAVFGYAVWVAGFWWDFETARGSNPNWFTNPQNCNWP